GPLPGRAGPGSGAAGRADFRRAVRAAAAAVPGSRRSTGAVPERLFGCPGGARISQRLDPSTIARRLEHVRSGLYAVPADALLVTHLPNIRYLTGFAGTAGAVILLQQRCLLMVDSRYVTAARALASPLPDGLLAVEPVANSYDEAIAQAVTREGVARLAIEAAHLTVARFNALAALIHRNNPRPATTNGRPTT